RPLCPPVPPQRNDCPQRGERGGRPQVGGPSRRPVAGGPRRRLQAGFRVSGAGPAVGCPRWATRQRVRPVLVRGSGVARIT
ncbi:hypothetical protein GTW71_35565, partial [Streptomyces sp. SID6041]|nr:hypothetical protein [Streptomyces sp. SID6041]